ncbi:class I SAM-dependent methyltransferase [Kitasatospora sp. NPDC086801]|uniref:class I SAM-dependent methyltransferase n=1 Tax=Kitasatospora sp. NPDC086801 TaxID=3364066 RepID=UPI00380164D3
MDHSDHHTYDQIFTLSTEEERDRLRHLTTAYDPITQHVIGSLLSPAGRNCLEIGAGSGSIAGWLADQGVQVTALDRDDRFLPTHPRLTTITGDALSEDFDPGPVFDLVHTRFVLIHVPRRDELLERLTSWLRPGGWLVIEETADTTSATSPRPHHRNAMAAMWRVMHETAGTDITWTRHLPTPLADHGLTDIGAHVSTLPFHGQDDMARMLHLSMKPLSRKMVDTGLVTEAELADVYADFQNPRVWDLAFSMVSAWGRRGS